VIEPQIVRWFPLRAPAGPSLPERNIMTPELHQLVQESWTRLAADAPSVARRFYANLFELAPRSRILFARVDPERQQQAFVLMLDDIVRLLDQPERCIPELAALGRRHVAYGVEPADYDTVGSALLVTLEESLGDAFTPRVRDAWMEAYRMIAAIMRRAAARMPAMLTGEMPAVQEAKVKGA